MAGVLRTFMGLLIGSAAVTLVASLLVGASALPLLVDVLVYRIVYLLAAVVVLIRGFSGGRETRPWLLLGAGLLAYFLGDLAYSISSHGVALPAIVPSVPDILWLLFYPLAFLALLLLTRRRLMMASDRSWIDAFVLGIGAFAVGVALIDAGIVADFSVVEPWTVAVGGIYLMGDLILLGLILSVAQAFDWRPPRHWWLLLGGFAVFAFADTVYASGVAFGTDAGDAWLHLLWPLSAVLLAAAAYLDDKAIEPVYRESRTNVFAPAIALIAAGVVLLWRPAGPFEWMEVTAAFVTLALAVARLTITVRDAYVLNVALRRAEVDPLTGLPNLRGLQSLGSARVPESALVVLGLDAFKDINITLGHEAGDRLLSMVAERLRGRTRKSDALFRMGGDQFAVFLRHTDVDQAAVVAENLIRWIEKPMALDGLTLHVSACAGVTADPSHVSGVAQLLQQADEALGQAKRQGPGIVQVYAAGAGQLSKERLNRRAEIRASFAAGGEDFVVHYQPIVSVDGITVLAVEALVRWRRAGVLLAPGEFMADLIRAGAMPLLTKLMLQKTLLELRDSGLDYPVTVNVSADLVAEPLIAFAEEALAKAGADASRLIVEITEDAIMRDPATSSAVLRSLRSRGIRVLIDDFGTGYSGLSSLRDLAVDGLKIDRSFVAQMVVDGTARAIVRGVATVAEELGLLVIYEGAEEGAVVTLLEGLRRGYIQGFAVARPMPIDDLVRWSFLRTQLPISMRTS